MHNGNLFLLCFLCLPAMIASGQATKTPTDTTKAPADKTKATATGQQIGTIVSSAIDTAFPVIGKIMDLFSGGSKSAKKDDVAASVKKAQTDFVASAKQKLQPAATVAKELSVVQAFGSAGASASENVLNITHLLASDKPDYSKVALEWGIAKNYLADVLTMKIEDVQAVRDTSIQARILTLQSARKDLMVRIDANIADAEKKSSSFSKQELQDQINSMSTLFRGFQTLATIELQTLQADIDDLSKWANQPAGVIKFRPRPPNAGLLKIVDGSAAVASKAAQSGH